MASLSTPALGRRPSVFLPVMSLASWSLGFSIQTAHFTYRSRRRGTLNIPEPLILSGTRPSDTVFNIVLGLQVKGEANRKQPLLTRTKAEDSKWGPPLPQQGSDVVSPGPLSQLLLPCQDRHLPGCQVLKHLYLLSRQFICGIGRLGWTYVSEYVSVYQLAFQGQFHVHIPLNAYLDGTELVHFCRKIKGTIKWEI